MRIVYIDVLVLGLLVLFYAFIFLGEVILALIFFVIAIVVSFVALLRVRYGQETAPIKEQEKS